MVRCGVYCIYEENFPEMLLSNFASICNLSFFIEIKFPFTIELDCILIYLKRIKANLKKQ